MIFNQNQIQFYNYFNRSVLTFLNNFHCTLNHRLGRVDSADIPEEVKSPLLLPTQHMFTTLLVQSIQHLIFHNGIRETLNAVRERYWIIRGREIVKQVLRKFIVCRKYQGYGFSTPNVAGLPPDRVADTPPFINTGVDFVVPIYVENSTKAYVCLFTCTTTRAIHLELMNNLGAPQFIQAFRRFVSLRGLPNKMLSDTVMQRL